MGNRPEESGMETPVVEKTTRDFEIKKVEEDGAYVLKVPRVEANRGDKIVWKPLNNHAISVWFPQAGVFYTPSLGVMHKGPVEAVIRDDAPDGIYEYAIYDHDEGEFVKGNSHPKVEIPKP
jgi:hypothetical protein